MLTRLRCQIFGCRLERDGYLCTRCGTDVCDGPFIDFGTIHEIRWQIKYLWHRYGIRRCEQCKRRFLRSPGGVPNYLCSLECDKKYIPF